VFQSYKRAAGGARSCLIQITPTEHVLQPVKFAGGLAFMFETCRVLKLTPFATDTPALEADYSQCWQAIPKLFGAAGMTKIVDLHVHSCLYVPARV
jgi:hypothetical protein